jgi:hypothetical protein
MTNNWTFDDGLQKHSCDSFPYAYRTLYNTLKRSVESGGDRDTLVRRYKIYSPLKTVYSYRQATELALDQGLLTSEGTINSREFKRL